jgi:hypothetical protein
VCGAGVCGGWWPGLLLKGRAARRVASGKVGVVVAAGMLRPANVCVAATREAAKEWWLLARYPAARQEALEKMYISSDCARGNMSAGRMEGRKKVKGRRLDFQLPSTSGRSYQRLAVDDKARRAQ